MRAHCKQSEEGGRFFQDVNHFCLIDLGKWVQKNGDEEMAIEKSRANGDHWLTLSEIRVLLQEDGWFTNEARSALSLLLAWL